MIVPLASTTDRERRALYHRLWTKDSLPIQDEPNAAAYDCPIRFQGQWQDSETELYYNGKRYFDKFSHQHLSSDPIGLIGSERPHAYVECSTTWIDPLGLSSKSGTATINWYDNRGPGNAIDHWSVETKTGNRSILTHQEVGPGTDAIIRDKIDLKPSKSHILILPDAKSAQRLQSSQIDRNLGPYNMRDRSCLTHVCEVLRSGGADVPTGAKDFFNFVRKNEVGP